MYRILVVEDEMVIAKTMKKHLEDWNFEVTCIKDFKKVMEVYQEKQPHVVLLDLTLPFYNGYYWCEEIRKISKVPILFISSAADNMNIIMAISMGGDDFLAKPFDLNVLRAKIQAIVRRAYDFGSDHHLLEHNGLIFCPDDGTVTYSGEKKELTKNQMRILQILLENKGKTVTRDRIMEKLWETDSFIDDNTLTVNVARLRRDLEEIGATGFVRTKKGIGYLIE
jgi:DNA-binding response OmpR family regulator